MESLTDEDLIKIISTSSGGRKQKAFGCLYQRYGASIEDYFYFALEKDIEKARDFAQDLFVKLLEAPGKFDPKQKFKPWVYRVASNMCKNEYRHHAVVYKYKTFKRYTATTSTQLNADGIRLRDCIKLLPAEKRSLIVLRFKINLSISEIAAIYNCPEGTIKSRLFYATKELSKYYRR